MVSCGKGNVAGESGCDMGGDGGRGVMGECHDCTLWKESCEPVGELLSTVSVGCDDEAVAVCAALEGGEVTSVSSGGDVTERTGAYLNPAVRLSLAFIKPLRLPAPS